MGLLNSALELVENAQYPEALLHFETALTHELPGPTVADAKQRMQDARFTMLEEERPPDGTVAAMRQLLKVMDEAEEAQDEVVVERARRLFERLDRRFLEVGWATSPEADLFDPIANSVCQGETVDPRLYGWAARRPWASYLSLGAVVARSPGELGYAVCVRREGTESWSKRATTLLQEVRLIPLSWGRSVDIVVAGRRRSSTSTAARSLPRGPFEPTRRPARAGRRSTGVAPTNTIDADQPTRSIETWARGRRLYTGLARN